MIACLYSDPNFLALNILENLLSKKCLVNIVTTDIKGWKDKTKNIANKNSFGFINTKDFTSNDKYNYAIFCGGFIEKDEAYTEIEPFLKAFSQTSTKTLAIFPFESFSFQIGSALDLPNNLAMVYLGDLLGPRIDLKSDLTLPQSINEIIFKKSLTVGVGEIYYPIFVSDAAKTISKWIFSFGPFGQQVFLLGPAVSATSFWKENQKLAPDLVLNYDSDLEIRKIPRGYETIEIPTNLNLSLKETYQWISSNWETKDYEKKAVIKKVRQKKVNPKAKLYTGIFAAVLLILLFPVITLAASSGLLAFSYRQFYKGHDGSSRNSILLAKTFFTLGHNEGVALSYIPIVGRIYKETNYLSDLGVKVSEMAINVEPMIRSSAEVFNKVLGDTTYDPTKPSQDLKSGLTYLYQSISLLQAESQTKAQEGIITAKKVVEKIDFERAKNISESASVLAGSLPSVLGNDGQKSYLVLFENNMELRPTGGFIGSFGITTFDKGRLNELNVNDVYSADGQLRGHVEPPEPIKNYLGEANWWLRDSNWDPDFPTSAKRAEWFLDKETDQDVDGVVSVDLQLVKDTLALTGPVFLPDFNLDVTADNLYEKTQSEVQDNFFPGTHKKASFLTALSRSLLTEIGKLPTEKRIHLLKAIVSNLEGRHVQVFLHDVDSQNAVDNLGWSGAVPTPFCGETCYPDLVSIVEANVGVNKANYFLSRSVNLDIDINDDSLSRKLTISYSNKANPALGLAGKYKVYLRAILPEDARNISVRKIVGASFEELNPELTDVRGNKEVGVLVEVLAGQKAQVEYSWTSAFTGNGATHNYGLYVRKQAGVSEDPWTIRFKKDGIVRTVPAFTLTKDGTYLYNVTLAKDFISRFAW